MIYVTNEAKQELKNLLSEDGGAPGACLRIMDRGEGKLGLDPDMMRPDDQVVEYNGVVLLIAGPRFASAFDNITLDAYTTYNERRLVISEEIINQSSRTVVVNWINLPQVPCRRN
jgi:Fe-S cluster assembly iron-binding protein IscA